MEESVCLKRNLKEIEELNLINLKNIEINERTVSCYIQLFCGVLEARCSH